MKVKYTYTSPAAVGCGVASGFYLLVRLAYVFISGLTLNYNLRFWLGVINSGQAVQFPSWPAYVVGPLMGGVPVPLAGVTFIVDKANVLDNDPYP